MDPVSVVAPLQKRSWVGIAATVTVALLVTVGAALMVQPAKRLLSRGGTAAEEKAPELEQATWRFDTRSAGATGKITKQQASALRRQRSAIRTTLKSIYNGVFLDPANLRWVLNRHFMPAAATSFKRAGAGVRLAGTVRTTYRGAEIAMEPVAGVRRAVATVAIRAVDVGRGRRVLHRATLWLQRPKSTWKVVAFDLAQDPLTPPSKTPKNKKKSKR